MYVLHSTFVGIIIFKGHLVLWTLIRFHIYEPICNGCVTAFSRKWPWICEAIKYAVYITNYIYVIWAVCIVCMVVWITNIIFREIWVSNRKGMADKSNNHLKLSVLNQNWKKYRHCILHLFQQNSVFTDLKRMYKNIKYTWINYLLIEW